MTPCERSWWKQHGQAIVDTMASSNGPDVVGLLHDRTSYGVYGDHGGATEEVAARADGVLVAGHGVHNTSATFHTMDVLPTILRAMGIPLTHPVDGQARALH